MSDSQAYEEVTAASDGVVVTKRFEADEFPVPAIAFNVSSERSEAVTVQLVDTVPEDVAVEDLGFHPEYGSEYWEINDEVITFEREIEPDSEYTTVYGIRATGTDDVQKFLTEPTLESVDPPLDDDADIVGAQNNAVKDVIAGDSDSIPGLDDDEDEEIETLNLADPNGEGKPAGRSPEEGTSEADGEPDATPETEIEDGNVIAAMAAEIRQNNVSAADVKILKRALDVVSEDEGSEGANTARIQRIQQDIADLRAYTDALETFLEENGTGEDMIEDFQQRLDGFDDRLQRFESEIETATSTAETATSTAETAKDDVSQLSDDVESLESNLDEMDENIDTVDSTLVELEEQFDTVESDIEELKEGMGDEVDERMSELEEEIEELKQWREQLSSVIGGGGE